MNFVFEILFYIRAFFTSQSAAPRVKFAPEPQLIHQQNVQHQIQQQQQQQQQRAGEPTPLQRSKSLSSAADAYARGIAGLGLGIAADSQDIGSFIPEIQSLIDQAKENPNKLNARSLMELANHIMQRAVEGRRLFYFFNIFLL